MLNVSPLKISLIQSQLHWHDKNANLDMFSAKLEGLENSDLIVLPETFTTGFTNDNIGLAESMEGKTVAWMMEKSGSLDSCLMGSILINENGDFRNRMIIAFPDGNVKFYDKKHLFTLAKENEHFKAGENKLVVQINGWKICPFICYDLRFPVWSRRDLHTDFDYDVLVYCANWPKKRASAWQTLLKARAIENMSYCIGVNRVGIDGNGHEYQGNSVVHDPLGEDLLTFEENEDSVKSVILDYGHLIEIRKKLNFQADADRFSFI